MTDGGIANKLKFPPTTEIPAMKTRMGPAIAALLAMQALAQAEPADCVQFNRDDRSILSDKCYYCHGPDSGKVVQVFWRDNAAVHRLGT